MSSSDSERARRILEHLRQIRVAEQAELIAPGLLRGLRGHCGITQAALATALSDVCGRRIVQSEISKLERSMSHNVDRMLQLAASRYLRNAGYDVDAAGSTLFVVR